MGVLVLGGSCPRGSCSGWGGGEKLSYGVVALVIVVPRVVFPGVGVPGVVVPESRSFSVYLY